MTQEEIFLELSKWSLKYEFNFQFWGKNNNNVFIAKDGIELYESFGFPYPQDAIVDALKYVTKINSKK